MAADTLNVQPFATGLDHPRWVHVLPNGDVLIAESNKQPRPPQGIRDIVAQKIMGIAGAGVPSANRITLLRDGDGDGVAELRSVFLDDLTSPFGMALIGSDFYVATTDALLRFPYETGTTRIDLPGEHIVALPANAPNMHWTKGLIAGADGQLFVSVGSNSDHGEAGMDAERNRAAIWIVDPAEKSARIYASGLRNPVGLDFEPTTGELWTVVNERDELGDDLVPDYLTSVRPGGFYGWPYVYYGDRLDPRVTGSAPDMVAQSLTPDYALGAHVAPLGLTFSDGARLGPAFAKGAFIGQHGSWNRRPASGYSVVYVPFESGRPNGRPIEILSNFRTADGKARGRPVGVAIAKDGALLVADDVGNTIWRVTIRDRSKPSLSLDTTNR
ncbi:sorbosone dehydrogenase family protein [Palleronia sp. LCG004]|uniref:PQQ-dependent sugar dehydrogenase n=1 Tax=Palleronia sp. LCG004 TaxID=3079304 RepID=UPI002942B90C|nr:sorbosone dehydrogenase family protein [Palleronia sp. LCG004]WOI55081.1 sorbosone dehydrogenase family protein [Palleronia sp. LCG004]